MTGAMSLNCIVGMTMMHPVEWHARKPEEVRAERARQREIRRLSGMTTSNLPNAISDPLPKTRCSSLTSLKYDNEKHIPLLIETLKVSCQNVARVL